MLLYLNADWQPSDAGELRLFVRREKDANDANNNAAVDEAEAIVDVAPIGGRLLVFQSKKVPVGATQATRNRLLFSSFFFFPAV
jgi:Rps23 Pro-64 3,4-dihydroxylase Tpa1-like proline 4-hydroxylase